MGEIVVLPGAWSGRGVVSRVAAGSLGTPAGEPRTIAALIAEAFGGDRPATVAGHGSAPAPQERPARGRRHLVLVRDA